MGKAHLHRKARHWWLRLMLNILLGHLLWGQVATMHPFRGLPTWTCASERQHDYSCSCPAHRRHPPLRVQSHLRHPTLEVFYTICQLSKSRKIELNTPLHLAYPSCCLLLVNHFARFITFCCCCGIFVGEISSHHTHYSRGFSQS